MPTKNNEYRAVYLMSGQLDENGDIVPETLFPLKSIYVAIGKETDFTIYESGNTGILCHAGSKGLISVPLLPRQHDPAKIADSYKDKFIHVIPAEIVKDSIMADLGGFKASDPRAKPWLEYLRQWVRTLHGKSEAKVTPRVAKFEKRHLIVSKESFSDQWYAAFYDRFTGPEYCMLFPRIRNLIVQCTTEFLKPEKEKSVFVRCTDKNMQTVSLDLILKKRTEEPSAKGFTGVLWGTPEKLPKGMTTLPTGNYTVEINPDLLISDISKPFKAQNRKYTVSAYVDFSIKSLCFETGIINIDPVSLEDALLLQFPERSARIISAIGAKASAEEAEGTEHTNAPTGPVEKENEFVKTFADWYEKASWLKEQYDASRVFIEPGKGYKKFRKLMAFVFDKCSPPESIEGIYTLSFGTIDFIKFYRDFLRSTDNHKLIIKGLDAIPSAIPLRDAAIKHFTGVTSKLNADEKFFRTVKESLIEQASKHSPEGEYRIFEVKDDDFLAYKPQVSEWLDDLRDPATPKLRRLEIAGEAAGSALGLLQELVSLAGQTWTLYKSAKNDKQWREDFYKAVQGYIHYCENGFSREALHAVEKYRVALLGARAGLNEAVRKELDAMINMALAICSIVPATAFPAGLVLMAREGIAPVGESLKKLGEAFDRVFLENFMASYLQNRERRDALSKFSNYNVSEITEVGGDSKHDNAVRQYCIRAEALNGFMKIVERAGSKVSVDSSGRVIASPEFLDELFDTFRIDEYVKSFLLGQNGEWVYPKDALVPVPLDTLWLYYVRYARDARPDEAKEAFKTWCLSGQTAAPSFPATPGSLVTAPESVKAGFQDYFPIHYVANGNDRTGLGKVSSVFSLNYGELPEDFIETILVYGWNGNKGWWEPVWDERTGEITAVTPFTPVRICVICKEIAESEKLSTFPLSIGLRRMGYLGTSDCTGPTYECMTTILVKDQSTGLLADGPGAGFEQPYYNERRQGVVLFPFYAFGGKLRYGLKPFQHGTPISVERLHRIGVFVEVFGSPGKRFFYPPTGPGLSPKPPLKRCAEIPLYINLHNGMIDTPEYLELQRAMIRDINFITHTSSNPSPQPPLLPPSMDFSIPGIFLFEGSAWRFIRNEPGTIHSAVAGCWGKPFEMIVALGVQGINRALKDSQDHDWRRIPLRLKWYLAAKSDIPGPEYRAAFYYIGCQAVANVPVQFKGLGNLGENRLAYTPSSGLEDDELPDHDGIDEPNVQTILQTRILPDKTFFGFMKSNTPWLYLGYFRCNYEMPDGRWIDGLRPFGSRAFLLGTPEANFYFKVHDEAAEGLGFAKRKDRFNLSLPSPLAPQEILPGGVTKDDLTDGFLDASKLNSSFVSINREIAAVME